MDRMVLKLPSSWKRFSPCERLLRQPAGDIGVSCRDVVGFPRVVSQIVKLGTGTIRIHEELPGAISRGKVRTAVWPLGISKEFFVAAVLPKEGGGARNRFAEQG